MAKVNRDNGQRAKSRGINRKSTDVADWGTSDAAGVVRAICAASIVGGALRFGYSRDGGAYAVGIYGDGEPYTEFLKPGQDVDQFVKDIEDLFIEIADELSSKQKAS